MLRCSENVENVIQKFLKPFKDIYCSSELKKVEFHSC